ncbi:MAG: hypothetical protein ABFD52_09080 [Acidobacteriota bacterium]
MFSILQKRNASGSLPAAGALSEKLANLADITTGDSAAVGSDVLGLFATASVEMWLRAVHSFLISASLTDASPIWASVAGYYSSHYSVRAFAHLLGYFLLAKTRKMALRVEVDGRQFLCHMRPKKSGDAEHKFYWRSVKEHSPFDSDPLYNRNDEDQGNGSDSGHRCRANYLDHIDKFPVFAVLDEAALIQRVQRIANMHYSDPPIPRVDSYPDIANVQLIAYHRMVGFRSYLDNRVAGNRFWEIYRNPSWSHKYLDFQVVEPSFVSSYREHLP